MTRKPAIAFTVIGGFLGSGKTSLLNHLLSHSDTQRQGRLYAMVNDFGALNIDAELIAAQNGNQIALSNGCVCCSIGDDFTRALFALLQEDPLPAHIIVEASGVADPARIAAFAAVDKQLRLNGVVTLVDATAYQTHAHDPQLADNYDRQIEAADLLLLSKIDLVGRAELDALHAGLEKRRPDVPRLEVSHGAAPLDLILGLEGTMPAARPLDSHNLETSAVHLHGPIDRDALAARLSTLQPHLIRAKGVLTDSRGAYVIHFAAGRVTLEEFDATPHGHFVIIGKAGIPNAGQLRALMQDLLEQEGKE